MNNKLREYRGIDLPITDDVWNLRAKIPSIP